MAAQVYTFHITYRGLEDRIWRDAEVSSRMRLDQLCFAVLAMFDTTASHLFEVEFHGVVYSVPDPDMPPEFLDPADFTLEDLVMEVGDELELLYDYGAEQRFLLTLTAVRPMASGQGRHFPYITAMSGRGIIDDLSADELREKVWEIDNYGQTEIPIYYSGDIGQTDDESFAPWDVNRYDLEIENCRLKCRVEEIEEAFAPFWEEKRMMERPAPAQKKPKAQQASPAGDGLAGAFFAAVLSQQPEALRKVLQKNAVVEWPCTNERFTAEEYIRANCEYPGSWDGEIVSVLPSGKNTVLITRVWSETESFHCVSVLRLKRNKIAALTEYWSQDGVAPEWRQELDIGEPID